MEIQEYLLALVNRMSDSTWEYIPEEGVERQLIREKAYEEAYSLTNLSYVEPLKGLIDQYSANSKKEKEIRSRVYSILEKIAINIDNKDIYEYFADRLNKETDKDLIGHSLLLYLNRSGYLPEFDKILQLIDDSRWQVRYEVIKLLGNYPKQEVEEVLLQLLDKAKDQYEITYLLKALGKIHSIKVLECLDGYLDHDKGEVRVSALSTLINITGKESLPIYIDGLKDRSPDVKLTALFGVLSHGDENVLGVLINRLKTILKTKRKYEPATTKDSDVISILNFLLRYKTNPEVTQILQWLEQKKMDYLFENERNWFIQNI